MNDPSNSYTGVAHPYLLTYDCQGRFVRMSQHAQLELGDSGDLPAEIVRQLRTGAAFRIWPVLMLPDTLVIGAQTEQVDIEEVRLGERISGHHRRLQRIEGELAARVRNRPNIRSGGVVRQMEGERQRLGRELHTGIGQMLAAIRLHLEVIAVQIPDAAETVKRALNGIGRLAGEALEQVREISRRLHPPEWQRLTLETALSQLWDVSGIPQRYCAQLSIQPLPYEPAQEIKVLFYRAAQEALANIARHSGATEVDLALEAGNGTVGLSIRDNGRGFDPSAIAALPATIEGGIGLRSIREEAQDLGAKLEIKSGLHGTTLSILAHFGPPGLRNEWQSR